MTKEFTCVVCPKSCRVMVVETPQGLVATGHTCPRGEKHALAEFTRPMRMLTSTVILEGGKLRRVPVISTEEIPKDMLPECMEYLYSVHVQAPVMAGQVIVENICDTQVDIVAARDMGNA